MNHPLVLLLGLIVPATASPTSTATLPPTRKMDVLEYEIGVEIGSRAFFADSAYKGDLEKAKAVTESLVRNLDARYLRAAGIKHRLGTVLIRTDVDTDPLRDSVTATGGGGKAGGSLSAFKNYWNSHSKEVGKTHDLAVYHVKSAPSGLAYVNSVGSGNRYATTGGNGATSWANGTVVHEFGHSWNLHHTNSSGFDYESKPRNSRGSHKAGGEDVFVSIMHGGGSHNIGRLATDEANMVYRIREQRRKHGDLVKKPGEIPPFGHRDRASAQAGKSITIDVIANDYDANNDVLDAQLLDTVSQKGGTIALSAGTGPGGRNEVIYTAPSSGAGKDFFHYTVVDKTGRTDWGAVYVTYEGDRVVDASAKAYNYDLGTLASPTEKGWHLITPKTTGDISWSGAEVEGADRPGGGANSINRDLIHGSGTSTLNHKVSNGLWAIVLNMGDSSKKHDGMNVVAEGVTIGSRVKSAARSFPYVNGEVKVTDGELNIEFSDRGGISRDWVVTRLSLTKIAEKVDVDLSATSYHYDFGPLGSPVDSGWTAISDKSYGDISWSRGELASRERKSANYANRDFVQSSEPVMFNHKIANGLWAFTLKMGDADNAHDQMGLKIEGQLIGKTISSAKGEFSEVIGHVAVTDGELNVGLFDKGGTDQNWVLNSLTLQRVEDVVEGSPSKPGH